MRKEIMVTLMDKLSAQLKHIISGTLWHYSITALIIINTIVLGMETYPSVINVYGELLASIDQTILYVFIIELILRFFAYRLDFFRNPWSIFDLCVIGIALVPSQDAFSALRAAHEPCVLFV